MAKVNRTVEGRPIQEWLAGTNMVQEALSKEAAAAAARAEALLEEHHYSGDASIERSHGDVDEYVILSDERGQRAALSIEFGRGPDQNGRGAMQGLFILHRATHYPMR